MVYYHFAELIHRQAEKYGVRTALKYVDPTSGKWAKVSWRDFSNKVMLTAKAIAEFGIEPHENIGVYSQNMPQCLYTDFGAYGPIRRNKSSISSMMRRSIRFLLVSNFSIIMLSRSRKSAIC